MMRRNMPIGIDDFKEVREKYYLVDKTDFIPTLSLKADARVPIG